MIREYKDVIRIEVGENALDGLLREQQLGFETIPSGSASIVRMGYKDSNGKVRYFTEDAGVKSGYWSAGQYGGICYNDGNVAVGCDPKERFSSNSTRFEIQDYNADYQIRISRDDSSYANIGFMGSGMFKIDVNNQTRDHIYVGTGVFGIVATGYSHITHQQGSGMLLESYSRNITIRAGDRIHLESKIGDFIFRGSTDGATIDKDVSRLNYNSTSDEIRFYRNRDQEYLSLSHNSFCINAYASKIECNVGGAMLLENNSGSITLKPGATDWVEAMNLFKLPTMVTDPTYKDGMDGCIYYNPHMGYGSVRICRNGVWQTLFS